MNEKGVDLDGALDWLAEYHEEVLSEFQAQYRALASWGPAIDFRVKKYVERLACFIRGIDCWAFETERYFGKNCLSPTKSRGCDAYDDGTLQRDSGVYTSQYLTFLRLARYLPPHPATYTSFNSSYSTLDLVVSAPGSCEDAAVCFGMDAKLSSSSSHLLL
jgi:hypothetical protein